MIVSALRWLRVVSVLAWNDIDGRYRRTALGPLWILIVHGSWLGSLYILSTGLFGGDPATYLPYLVSSVTMWNLISNMIVGSSGLFLKSAGYMQSMPFSPFTYVVQFNLSVLIVFAHQFLVVLGALIALNLVLSVQWPLFFAALAIYSVFGLSVGVLIGFLGARFRDTTPMLESAMMVLFLVTPVFWQKSFLRSNPWIVDYNPFAHLLEIGRAPLLGQTGEQTSWIVSISLVAVLAFLAIIAFLRFRSRLFFWIQ
jgi:ABC-type polysaccharide/polyol phosphate export permease